MEEYTIKIVNDDNINWEVIESLEINNYPWYESGLKQSTNVKVVIHDKKLKIQAFCEDIHSYSTETKLNGDVYLDSCFEFFVTPSNNLGGGYFNMEINCCGVLHLAYKDEEGARVFCTQQQSDRITIIPSIKTTTKSEDSEDESWSLYIELPIEVMEEISGNKIQLNSWYGNFYRCGGKTEPQYATWNNINWDFPQFHLPKQFGKLSIV